MLGGHRVGAPGDVCDEAAHLHRATLDGNCAGLGRCQREQVADQARQPIGFVDDVFYELLALRPDQILALQNLCIGTNDRNRRT